MISKKEQEKINDFREAFRSIINKDNDRKINEIIDALFYNVECNYMQFQDEVKYVPVNQELYKYHILQPQNGQYTLLDFLINRAITNVDAIELLEISNQYTSHRLININPSRYNSMNGEYSNEYLSLLALKTNLHETGHAIQNRDPVRDDYIHCSSKHNFEEHPKAHLTDFMEKLSGFAKILSYKYPNMLHEWMIPESTEQRELEEHDYHWICNKEMYEEAFTEYYATKYAGLYDDTSYYRGHSMGKEKNGKIPVIYVPNSTNNYSPFSKFIFHLDNLVSKEAMFETKFMGNDRAFQELSEKYSNIIDGFWEANDMPQLPDSLAKVRYLFDNVCIELGELSEEQSKKVVKNHYLLDLLFTHIYAQELSNGTISREKMLKIAEISELLSPATYDINSNTVKPTAVKEWYQNQHKALSKTISTQELGRQAKEGIENTLLVDEYSNLISDKKKTIQNYNRENR